MFTRYVLSGQRSFLTEKQYLYFEYNQMNENLHWFLKDIYSDKLQCIDFH